MYIDSKELNLTEFTILLYHCSIAIRETSKMLFLILVLKRYKIIS